MEPYQLEKIINYKALNRTIVKGGVLFTGSSLMEGFPVTELCMTNNINKHVYNRGVSGFNSEQFIDEIDTMLFALEPSKIFINIGTNDMTGEPGWFEHLMENYDTIIDGVKNKLPDTEVYIMAFYPVCPSKASNEWAQGALTIRTQENIAKVNKALEEKAARYNYHYIDVNNGLTEADGYTKEEYSIDGIHMYASGYQVVFENVKKYI